MDVFWRQLVPWSDLHSLPVSRIDRPWYVAPLVPPDTNHHQTLRTATGSWRAKQASPTSPEPLACDAGCGPPSQRSLGPAGVARPALGLAGSWDCAAAGIGHVTSPIPTSRWAGLNEICVVKKQKQQQQKTNKQTLLGEHCELVQVVTENHPSVLSVGTGRSRYRKMALFPLGSENPTAGDGR